MHMITLVTKVPSGYTSPSAPVAGFGGFSGYQTPNIAINSLTLDADAPGSVARIGEYVRDTLARGYIVEASAAPTETATEPVA